MAAVAVAVAYLVGMPTPQRRETTTTTAGKMDPPRIYLYISMNTDALSRKTLKMDLSPVDKVAAGKNDIVGVVVTIGMMQFVCVCVCALYDKATFVTEVTNVLGR